MTAYTVVEGGDMLAVCANITQGFLDRDVVTRLATVHDGTALCEECKSATCIYHICDPNI